MLDTVQITVTAVVAEAEQLSPAVVSIAHHLVIGISDVLDSSPAVVGVAHHATLIVEGVVQNFNN